MRWIFSLSPHILIWSKWYQSFHCSICWGVKSCIRYWRRWRIFEGFGLWNNKILMVSFVFYYGFSGKNHEFIFCRDWIQENQDLSIINTNIILNSANFNIFKTVIHFLLNILHWFNWGFIMYSIGHIGVGPWKV